MALPCSLAWRWLLFIGFARVQLCYNVVALVYCVHALYALQRLGGATVLCVLQV